MTRTPLPDHLVTMPPFVTYPLAGMIYDPPLEREIAAVQRLIEADETLRQIYNPRWLAVALLEGDPDLVASVQQAAGGPAILNEVERVSERVMAFWGEDVGTLIADQRYRFIADLVHDVVTRPSIAQETLSDRIDRVVTHPWLGLLIFLGLMWFVFQMTANVPGIYVDWIDRVISGPLARWVAIALGVVGLDGSWFESLVIDGVLAGAGGVLAFVPSMVSLYFFLGLLEDTGYMARAAFVMDRFMQRLGLHGKSFIPLLVGFGCSVPGIYATRTLEDRRDRILTGLLVPFMSCAARLPVYVLLGAAFFGAQGGNLVFAMYVTGILTAIGSGFLFRRTLFRRGDQTPFVMELPPFHRPSLRVVGRQVHQRTLSFIQGVWTVIMAASIGVWVLLNVPYRADKPPAVNNSLFGDLSRGLAPVFEPAGFGTWQASGSLVTGLLAKEVIVSTMIQVYEVEPVEIEADKSSFEQDVREIVSGFGTAALDTLRAVISLLPGVDWQRAEAEDDISALQAALREQFTALQAVAFAVFVLLYTPCMATVAALRHELGGRWMAFSVAYMLGVAWMAAVIVYQGGQLLGLG